MSLGRPGAALLREQARRAASAFLEAAADAATRL
jgi:hypothetical protein